MILGVRLLGYEKKGIKKICYLIKGGCPLATKLEKRLGK